MNDIIRVGIADYKICQSPQVISTLGLGSCLGVVLYDKSTKICGLAHIMLPDSSKIADCDNRMKFADTCLEDMYQDLMKRNVNVNSLIAKIAGGAKMFSYQSDNELLNIGEQNVRAVKEKLREWDIPVVAEDVGETYGRTIEFFPETGKLYVKAVGLRIHLMI